MTATIYQFPSHKHPPKSLPPKTKERIIRTSFAESVKVRVDLLAAVINNLISIGYSNDMINWNKMNELLNLDEDDTLCGLEINSFSDFRELFLMVNEDISWENCLIYKAKKKRSPKLSLWQSSNSK